MNPRATIELRILTGVVVLCFFAPFVFFFIIPRPVVLAARAAEITRSELPYRISIPRIGVDASIEHVGLTDDGVLAVPQVIANVGWFEEGPRPGEIGSAVIDGHFGWIDEEPAVFDDLHSIAAGDHIFILDITGSTTLFAVREIKSYEKYSDATDIFTSSDGKAHLNLITCEGFWDEATQTYAGRLVVFADKE